ncbi:MAG: hypothetical protein WCC84_09625 [Candidatus Cybelea sp.]
MLTAIALSLELIGSTVGLSPPAATAPLRLAVPPFIAQPIGMEDEVLPTSGQLAALQTSFVHALNSMSNFRAVRIAQPCSPDSVGTCDRSRSVAIHAGAAVVVQAYITRHMAIWWDVDFAVIDCRTGRSSGPWVNEIKGDFDAVMFGMPTLAASIAKRAVSIETRS